MTMQVYTVTHHTQTKEYKTSVVACSKLRASELVNGDVMHVSDGEDIREGMKISSSGWSFSFISPSYNSPSHSWIEYLKSINLTGETEE